MAKYQLIKNYQENLSLKTSFNQLAQETFGLDFSSWYNHGFWQTDYVPYAFIENQEIIANASFNRMKLVIDHKNYHALQIGTVMTKTSHRNQGLSRKLLEAIIADHQKTIDFIYLFANESVLDFYPKLDFQRVSEVQGKLLLANTHLKNKQSELVQLGPHKSEDVKLVLELAKNRQIVSQNISVTDNHNLLMFYFLVAFPANTFYLPKQNAVVMFEEVESVIHLFDVIYQDEELILKNVLEALIENETTEIVFYFNPQEELPGMIFEKVWNDDDALFVLGGAQILGEGNQFPLTSHC